MGHVLLIAAAVLVRSDAVLHRTTRSLASRRAALAALAFKPVATKADEPIELPNGCTYRRLRARAETGRRRRRAPPRFVGERRLQGRAALSSY